MTSMELFFDLVYVFAFGRQTMGRNYAQLLAWSAIAGVVWIAGAFVPGDARLAGWAGALVLDLSAPMHGFRLPGIPATFVLLVLAVAAGTSAQAEPAAG